MTRHARIHTNGHGHTHAHGYRGGHPGSGSGSAGVEPSSSAPAVGGGNGNGNGDVGAGEGGRRKGGRRAKRVVRSTSEDEVSYLILFSPFKALFGPCANDLFFPLLPRTPKNS